MVAPFVLAAGRAALGLGGRALGAGKMAFAGGKIPGGIVGQKALEYGAVIPALGFVAGAAGLPFGYSKPAPQQPIAGAGPGGMALTPEQFGQLYGQQGFRLPWQSQEGFYQEQAREQRRLQRDLAQQSNETLRYGAGLNYNLGVDSNRTRERLGLTQERMNRDSISGNVRIANIGLEGMRDTNRSRVRMAEIDANTRLNAVYDTNRRDVRIADIGANRDRYLADRSVEVARWQGSPMRVAAFGSIMGQRY